MTPNRTTTIIREETGNRSRIIRAADGVTLAFARRKDGKQPYLLVQTTKRSIPASDVRAIADAIDLLNSVS